MTLSAVAARYANALADVVTAGSSALQPRDAAGELRAFEAVLSQSDDLRGVLNTPAIAGSRKKAVVGRLADLLKLSRISRNFLLVLIGHRRITLLGEILQAFEIVLDERSGYIRAEIASAGALGEAERAQIAAELEKLTGKRIRAAWSVDDALIGGVVAKAGSTVYDGSVRGSLESLRQRLSAAMWDRPPGLSS
jgi:F-type H+-transporting ATPase subunit delta